VFDVVNDTDVQKDIKNECLLDKVFFVDSVVEKFSQTEVNDSMITNGQCLEDAKKSKKRVKQVLEKIGGPWDECSTSRLLSAMTDGVS